MRIKRSRQLLFVLAAVLLFAGCRPKSPAMMHHLNAKSYEGPATEHVVGDYSFSLPAGFSAGIIEGRWFNDECPVVEEQEDMHWPYHTTSYSLSFSPWGEGLSRKDQKALFDSAWAGVREACLTVIREDADREVEGFYAEDLKAAKLFGFDAVTVALGRGLDVPSGISSFIMTPEGLVTIDLWQVPRILEGRDISLPTAEIFKKLPIENKKIKDRQGFTLKYPGAVDFENNDILLEYLDFSSFYAPSSEKDSLVFWFHTVNMAPYPGYPGMPEKRHKLLEMRETLIAGTHGFRDDFIARTLIIDGRRYKESVAWNLHENPKQQVDELQFVLSPIEPVTSAQSNPFTMSLSARAEQYEEAAALWNFIVDSLERIKPELGAEN